MEYTLDFVDIPVGEEVAISMEVRVKRAENAVEVACACAASSQGSHIEFVIFAC